MTEEKKEMDVVARIDHEARAEVLKEEIKSIKAENRKQEREKQKELKKLAALARMDGDVAVWKEITKLKEMVNQQIKANKLTARYSIKDISTMPDFFTYQNPDNKKLKTNNKDDKWIHEYLNAGGKEITLIETAAENRIAIWKKMKFKRGASTNQNAAPSTSKAKPSKVSGGVG
jgi:hypothetical protein